MSPDESTHRSRRAILASAVGGLAALAAAGLGRPASVLASDPNDVVLGADNVTSAGVTRIKNNQPSQNSFHAVHDGTAVAVLGESAHGYGVQGISSFSIGVLAESFRNTAVMGSSPSTDPDNDGSSMNVGVMGIAGDNQQLPGGPIMRTGLFGHSSSSDQSTGVWGDSPDGVGVAATGDWGVYATGSVGVVADAVAGATGLFAYAGDAAPPAPLANRAVYAVAATTSQIALETNGRIRFTNRSGRTYFAANASSKKIGVPGVTSGSWAIATLQTNRTGIYVQAAVCTTGYVTIYLNKAVTATTYVGYMVIG